MFASGNAKGGIAVKEKFTKLLKLINGMTSEEVKKFNDYIVNINYKKESN
jgi:hypothetical protein